MSSIRRFSALLLVALTIQLFTAVDATAQSSYEPFQWQPGWERAGWLTVGSIGALFAGGAGIQYGIGAPTEPNWTGPVLFDDAVRSSLLPSTQAGIERAGQVSDGLMAALIAAPVLIEPGMALLGHGNPDSAGQVALMNAQALGVTFFATTALKHMIGRQRPPEGACYDDPDADPGCAKRDTLSFPSGHTSMSFAGAGLVCLNHEQFQPLGGPWDKAACYTALGAAATVGALRIASNSHYLTDVLAGAALGLAGGYLFPKWLYFGFGDDMGMLSDGGGSITPQVGEVNGVQLNFTW